MLSDGWGSLGDLSVYDDGSWNLVWVGAMGAGSKWERSCGWWVSGAPNGLESQGDLAVREA